MIPLPKGSLIGNPLYVPVRIGDEAHLEFVPASAGLWVARPSSRDESLFGTRFAPRQVVDDVFAFEGRLAKTYLTSMGLFGVSLNCSFNLPTTLDELLKQKLLVETTYLHFFRKKPHLLDAYSKIPDFQQAVYKTTQQYRVSIYGGMGKPTKQQNRLEERVFDGNELPQPA